MAGTARPRRSVLYMPGSNDRALEKAAGLAADGLILDLEDATAPESKVDARDKVVAASNDGRYGRREVLIRTNGLDTAWGYEDIRAAAGSKCDGILLPKVESADMVRRAEAIMDSVGAPPEMRLWTMMETPLGCLNAKEICGSTARMGGIVMGTSDLAKDLQCAHTMDREPMITSLGLCLLAARAYGLAALDGVYLDLKDDEGFAASCKQGQELGFDGKTLIHPKTIGMANTAFAPDPAAIELAHRMIEAHAEAAKEGKGVVLLDGKLVENLHVMNAQRLVAEAEAIKSLEADLA
ncbi:MAG: HpcH/HpaI aldolase/citrate lyase family protein [Rhodospirillaceae bacterium]